MVLQKPFKSEAVRNAVTNRMMTLVRLLLKL